MEQMQPDRRRQRRRRGARCKKDSGNLGTACRIGIERKINNERVLQALADVGLLSRQVVTQPMAIRMSLARRMRLMPVGIPIVVVAAIGHRE